MRKVTGYVKRHLKQKPKGDVEDSSWRYSSYASQTQRPTRLHFTAVLREEWAATRVELALV